MKDFLTTSNGSVFIIETYKETFFCHLESIPDIVSNSTEDERDFFLYEYWNFKKKILSKKFVNEMFEAHKIDFRFRTFK